MVVRREKRSGEQTLRTLLLRIETEGLLGGRTQPQPLAWRRSHKRR